jgi:hypothetical protein
MMFKREPPSYEADIEWERLPSAAGQLDKVRYSVSVSQPASGALFTDVGELLFPDDFAPASVEAHLEQLARELPAKRAHLGRSYKTRL